jgi:UDP-glucuronate decarboxylase
MSTCLVTGGAGFLGSHLCDELLARGHRVICVDNLETGSLANIEHIRDPDRFLHLNLDIIEPYHIGEPVDFVYHLASPASPIDYLRLPLHTLKTGSYGTHHTLGLAKHKRARFLLASTSEVYGDPLEHPQPESYWGHVNPIGPRGVYDEAKRYAEALTMAYHRQQGVDTAIVRIFNSIVADEQVVYDDGRELRREAVGQAAERAMATARVAYRSPAGARADAGAVATVLLPACEYLLSGYSVPAFGADARIAPARTDGLVAHPNNARCFEVRTRYGRSIRVTADHSIFVEGAAGEPLPRAVEELEVGDRVAIAGRLDVPVRDRCEVSVLDAWAYAEGDPWDLFVEAEGAGDRAWSHRQELFGMLVSQRRNSGPNWRNGAWTKLIRMRKTGWVPLPVLRRLGVELDATARVRQRPGARASLPVGIPITDSLLWLLGLWVAEGSWYDGDKGGCLTVACEEPVLRRAQKIVEQELGLHVSLSERKAQQGAQIHVHSKLLLRVMEYLGFGPLRKRIPGWILGLPLSRLKWFLEGYREGDGVHSGAHFKEGVRHAFVTASDELKDDLIVALARFGLVPSVGRYTTKIKRKSDRLYPFWALTLCGVSPWSPLEWDEGVKQTLDARRTGDLIWACVTAIEEIEPTPLVYDFCVPGRENFWAGTGVIAHNTYGPRMRPHDGRAIPTFLRQALANRPITVFGDGTQTRSFCYVSDEIRGLIALAESGYHYPVNIGNPDEFTLLELAEAVKEITEASSEIVFEALPEDDPKQRRPDITLARELLGWSPGVSLRDGLRNTIEASGAEILIGGSSS